MLVRITWALVVAALGTLIGGFFTPDSNVLLFVAIGLALAVILLVLVSWARRAREATSYGFEGRRRATVGAAKDTSDEELFAALERDEEFAVGGTRRARRPRQRPARRTTAARPGGKPKAKPKPKAKAKPKAGAARKTTASKAKPARKAKPKAQRTRTTRPKARQPRRRPPETPAEPPSAPPAPPET